MLSVNNCYDQFKVIAVVILHVCHEYQTCFLTHSLRYLYEQRYVQWDWPITTSWCHVLTKNRWQGSCCYSVTFKSLNNNCTKQATFPGFGNTELPYFTHWSTDSTFTLMMVFWQLKHCRCVAHFSSGDYKWVDIGWRWGWERMERIGKKTKQCDRPYCLNLLTHRNHLWGGMSDKFISSSQWKERCYSVA